MLTNRKSSRAVAAACLAAALAGAAAPLESAQRFRRGDVNADAALDISDALRLLGFLYIGIPNRLGCEDAADANDDGELNIADPVRTLTYLFGGGPELPAPFAGCGDDATVDALGCESYDICAPTPPAAPAPPVLEAPSSPTRAASTDLHGTAGPGLLVRITGGKSPVPIEVRAGPAGGFTAAVALGENRLHRLFAVAVDAEGRTSAPRAAEVIQDSELPFVYVDEPADGSTVMTESITVTGRVSDMLSGFLGLEVTVNGAPAAIAIGIGTNGTFERQDVPLKPGENTITAAVMDAVGNVSSRQVRVRREGLPPGADRLELVSGNGQKRPIHNPLPEPIVVRAAKEDGTAIAGKLVTFRVTRSDGRLAARPGVPAAGGVMSLAVLTGPEGLAAAYWTLGSDAGCGNNRVRASGAGLAGEARFCASAAPGPAVQINVGSGNNQRGEAGSPAREPLKAWVSDGCNGIAGVPVTFRVTSGTGAVNGALAVTVPTGPTGHAQVAFVFGPEAGSQSVSADFEGNFGAPAAFLAHALVRAESRPTTFAGLVLDNAAQPIQRAVCILEVPGFEGVQSVSDIHGRFTLEAPGAGPASLRVEGGFSTHVGGEPGVAVPPGSYPSLTYEVTLVPNAESSLPGPVLLPALDPDNAAVYDGTTAVVLRVKGVDGLAMRIAAGTTVTLQGGSKVGPGNAGSVRLSLNQVHHDDVPMPMTDGAAPPLAWTLQPAGARFDPPVSVSYPNLSALEPGAIANFLSFNHDTGKFEIVASGSVSTDGSSIETDPGSGISLAGWGCNCPPYAVTGDCIKCNLKITAPKEAERTFCVGQRFTVSVSAGPSPGKLTWVTGGTPLGGTYTSTGAFGSVIFSFDTVFESPGKKTISVFWDCGSSKVAAATIDVTIAETTLHPLDSDFLFDPFVPKAGRVMISTKHDDLYYTLFRTTKADRPAQTEDGKVTITAHLQPAAECAGKTVYFRSIDPDDASPYEAPTLSDDNRDPAVKKGILSAGSAVAEARTIDGTEVAAAEVVLTMTSQYAGDNYQVEASFDPKFKHICGKTSVLTAWKRIYIEQDNMYQKGATLLVDQSADADAIDDFLIVDSTADFKANDIVAIFSPTDTLVTVVQSVTASGLVRVPDLPRGFPKYSGIRLTTDITTVEVGTDFLTRAYGEDTRGTDGGTFVEFVTGVAGSGSIPKFSSFRNDIESFAFCQFWFDNSANKDNLFQLVAAHKHNDGSLGTTDEPRNISFITTGNYEYGVLNFNAIPFGVTHELGHQFSVANGHVDQLVNARNHNDTDECLMSYNTDYTDAVAEFDTDCLYDVRDAADPR